jgi:hypothetical protein
MRFRGVVIALTFVAAIASDSWGQSKQKAAQRDETKTTQQPAATDQRGTEQLPAIVKILPAQKTAEEAEADRKDRAEKAETDWWLIKLTGALALVGALQLIVFGQQARRLRQTVEAAAQQSKDMEKSIAEAARAATAMEAVAESIAISAKAAVESVTTVRDVSARQMRAYLSVSINTGIYQERERNLKFDVRPVVFNSGHTPAHKLTYWASARILPNPLPDNFDFPVGEDNLKSGFVLGPHQNIVINAMVQDFVSDDEAQAIKAGIEKRVYVWGIIFYEDVFGESRQTKFCHSIYWIAGPKGELINGNYAARHNEAT